MKAAVVESPGQLTVKDIPQPQTGEYGALCRLLYGATCSGTDLHLIADKMPWKVNYPIVLGHESIGRVVEVGRKVRNFKPGDLVTRVGTLPIPELGLNVSWGGFCEFGVAMDHRAMREDGLPRDAWNAWRINQPIPDSYDAASSTMIITWRETLSYTRRMGITRDSRVLILGSGGVGMAFAAHARNLGAATIGSVGSPLRQDRARVAGVTAFFDYRDSALVERLLGECAHFDFIIDAVGKAGQVNRVLPLLKPGGMLGIYGLDDFDSMHINPLCAAGTFSVYGGGYDEEETHSEVISRMADGSLDARVWLDLSNPYELVDIQNAFDAVKKREAVKALVRLSGD